METKLTPCTIHMESLSLDAVDGLDDFNALDAGFPLWNGWFDGYVEKTDAIVAMFAECNDDIEKIKTIQHDGKIWVRTNGYCFWPPKEDDE